MNMEQFTERPKPVRCKFVVESVKKIRQGGTLIEMVPVSGGSPENDSFWHYTPSGKLELFTTNELAAAGLELGKSYYIDILPAEH